MRRRGMIQRNPTRRERQIFNGLARGWKNGRIAEEIGISESTVKVYASRMFKKFGVTSRLEAALFWQRNFIYE